MKSSYLLIVTLVVVCVLTIGSIATSQNQRAQQNQNQRQLVYEYATMNSQANQQQNNGMVYTVTWNAGIQDIIGRSNSSIDDAMRRLNSQLGGNNNSRTNLSVLLSTVGANGWRLVESNQNDFGMTRIFIRARSNQ